MLVQVTHDTELHSGCTELNLHERMSGYAGCDLGWEPVSGIEPLTCRLQDGCSAY
jgi:hypothetical protein